MVRPDDKGIPSLQGINDALRLLAENIYKMEGRVGEVAFRDSISVDGDISGTSVTTPTATVTTLFTFAGPAGTLISIGYATETLTLSTSGVSSDTVSTTLLPTNALILAVPCRVVTAITGATTFGVGTVLNTGLYATGVLPAKGTIDPGLRQWRTSSNVGTVGPVNPTLQGIRITAAGGVPTGGAVELVVFSAVITPPTS